MNDKEIQQLLKKLLKERLSQQVEDVKDGEVKKSQSFAFLDDQMLQMLLLLLMTEKPTHGRERQEASPVNVEMIDELDHLMKANKQEFEEILDLLNS